MPAIGELGRASTKLHMAELQSQHGQHHLLANANVMCCREALAKCFSSSTHPYEAPDGADPTCEVESMNQGNCFVAASKSSK